MIILAAIALPLAVLAIFLLGCLPCFQFCCLGAAAAGGAGGDDDSYLSEDDEDVYYNTGASGYGSEGIYATAGPSPFAGALVENVIYGRSGGPRFGPPIVVDGGEVVENSNYGRAPSYYWGNQQGAEPPSGYGAPRNFPRPASYASAAPSPRRFVPAERAYETIPGDEPMRMPVQESHYPVTPGFGARM